MEIVASGRIKVLEKFYVGKVSNAALIEEELKSAGTITEDVKGQWVTEQFIKAATTLHVDAFVKPVDQGGVAIPEIQDFASYEVAHLKLKAVGMANIEASLGLRRRAEKRAMDEVNEAEKVLERLETELGQALEVEDPDGAVVRGLKAEIGRATKVAEAKYSKWNPEQVNLQKDLQAIEDWKESARKGAMSQRDSDSDALRQVVNALALLKKFLAGLITQVPGVGPIVRQMGEFGGDPYECSDMRKCYANLLAKYRKTEDLDVASTVIISIKDSQGEESLGTFTRRVQEFHEEMVKMGIRQISISDLTAIIVISGMKEASRRVFLQTETTLALAKGTEAESDDPGDGLEDDKTIGGSKVKRSLLGKTLRFVAQQESEENLLAKLSGNNSVKKSVKPGNPVSLREAQKRVTEAQLAFATTVKASDAQACFEFARSGTCSKGDQCRFKHEVSAASTGAGGGGGRPCFDWKNKGECRFGNQCKFSHTQRAIVPKPSVTQVPTKAAGAVGKQASQVLFTKDRVASDSEDEVVDVVIARSPPVMACATSEKMIMQDGSMVEYLGWDTMCSLHVASHLGVIPGALPLRKPKEAVGMGGVKPITHKGHSAMFGKDMSYIQGGGTPNLLSVGQECQRDASGMQGLAVFSANGAVRMRVTPELIQAFAELVNRAEAEGLVQGKAVLHNNVYKEAFGTEGHVELDEVCPVDVPSSAFAISHSMFASRIRLDSVDNVLDFMVASGLSKDALLEGVKNQSLRGLPAVVSEEHVKHYFKRVGKSVEQLEAEITKAPLRMPVDYEVERAAAPGAVMQIDNVDPSFSRMAASGELTQGLSGDDSTTGLAHKKVVPSVGGYKDAVLAVDEASGYAHLLGRVSKKDPHKVLAQFVGKWQGRWGALKFIKADKEFVTHESVALVQAYDVRFRQAVPGDHRRTISMVEGSIRWILELGQGNMNRLRKLVKDKVITERQARTLWFHALRQAVFVFNFRPALSDPTKTRYEVGTGDVANLSNVVLMPFGMRVMGKNLIASADGRGSECIYIGPSSTVRGGILTYSIATERVSVKYTFLPINEVKRPVEAQVRRASKEVYGKMLSLPEGIPLTVAKGVLPGWEEVAGFGSAPGVIVPESVSVPDDLPVPPVDKVVNPEPTGECSEESESVPLEGARPIGASEILPDHILQPVSSDSVASGMSTKSGGGCKVQKREVVSDYNTRRRAQRVNYVEEVEVLAEEDAIAVWVATEVGEKTEEEVPSRPPKPKVPSSRMCNTDPKWIAAEEREAAKLMEEDTFMDLPVDGAGRPVRPKDAVVLRLLKIREYKWKPDPITGVEGWLECVRLVCDGSVDKRPEKYYAETPDRTLLLLMTSIEASMGIKATGSDVTRAYLNAESIDRNIVILAPPGLKGLPRESLLNKGLYGSRGGALSWQVWIDGKLQDLGYAKLQVCRGVYMKVGEYGQPVRAYRHSDDFRLSSASDGCRMEAERNLRNLVRMAEFSTLVRFLGCTFERVNADTGLPDENGTIVLVRQEEKILEMSEKFQEHHEQYNPKGRVRKNALPVDAIKEDHDLDVKAGRLLSPREVEVYQSIVGCIQWVVGCTRSDAKLGSFLLSTRLAKPRDWDMYLAVYVMDYLVATVEVPLVLGGDDMDPIVYADASFAILPERRSIMGHVAFSGKSSGAIYAQVGSTKTAVTSVWEAELMAGCAGMDTGIYLTNACTELKYEVPVRRVIRVDNKAEIDWVKGSVSNKRSRHVDVRYYRSRHLQESGEISCEYVSTEENVADMLTKPLMVRLFIKFARIILGHCLVLGKGIRGIIEKIPVDSD